MDVTNKNQHNEKEEQERTVVAKKATIEAMRKCLGVVTQACKMVGIDRSTYYEWYREDVLFKEQCDDCLDIALDFAESKLHKQIEEGVPVSTIFFLKTKGKRRGYIERNETDLTTNGKELPTPIIPLYVPRDNSNAQDQETNETN